MPVQVNKLRISKHNSNNILFTNNNTRYVSVEDMYQDGGLPEWAKALLISNW